MGYRLRRIIGRLKRRKGKRNEKIHHVSWVLPWPPSPRLRLSGEYRPGDIALFHRGVLRHPRVRMLQFPIMVVAVVGKSLILGNGRDAVSIGLGKGDGNGRV
jgi:hypothetical protein